MLNLCIFYKGKVLSVLFLFLSPLLLSPGLTKTDLALRHWLFLTPARSPSWRSVSWAAPDYIFQFFYDFAFNSIYNFNLLTEQTTLYVGDMHLPQKITWTDTSQILWVLICHAHFNLTHLKLELNHTDSASGCCTIWDLLFWFCFHYFAFCLLIFLYFVSFIYVLIGKDRWVQRGWGNAFVSWKCFKRLDFAGIYCMDCFLLFFPEKNPFFSYLPLC